LNERVTKFNHIVGKTPLGQITNDRDVIWQQIEQQAALVLEEAKEQYDAAVTRNMTEVLDGHLDTRFTNEYIENLLKAVGVDVAGGWHSVLSNNESKFTTSFEYAEASSLEYLKQKIDVYIDATDYEGTRYYVVKRFGDNKVMKLKDHVKPNLGKFVPDDWKKDIE